MLDMVSRIDGWAYDKMVKRISNMFELNVYRLKPLEKFIVTSLLGENKMKYLGRRVELGDDGKEKTGAIVGGFIWEDDGKVIVRICKYSSSTGTCEINIGEYKNLEKGDKDYERLYNLLK